MQAIKMRFIISLTLLWAVVCSALNSSEFRLPDNFKPISYRLDVTTHLDDKFVFEGVVDIKIICSQDTDTVVLHSSNLNINTKGVVVANNDGKIFPVSSIEFISKNELMFVKSSEKLKSGGEYVLTIPFTGNITDDLVGYYKSSYLDKDTNQTKWLAVTQFEPADARRAFPCFDEPAMKATFKIRLGHQKDLTSVSNMRLLKTTPMPSNPDYVLDEFEDSVPMSTYLVAYMVSDFAFVDSESQDDEVKFRILARKGAVDQTELAKLAGPLVLKYYEDYFDEKFPLTKQDMVAIPDFSAGAMENWGLVTYRETELLIDPTVATSANIHRVAEVIAHELAHQWFGNLVTMKWWTDLWLNEGFATYVAARGVDFLYPEWNSFQVETAQNFLQVLGLDSLKTSHPVSVPVGHPDEIAQIFDTISYTKGSFLLHMMNSFLGEETFKQGIRNYIDKHKFSNAEQDDLWSSLTDEAHRVGSLDKNTTVKEIMDTWTLQTGYPVLKVTRDYSSGMVTLSQERYLAIKPNVTDQKSCWMIPLTMTNSADVNFNNTKAEIFLDCKTNVTLSMSKDIGWIIFNMQMAGLFRVLYDSRNWMGIISTLNDPNGFEKIHTLNRVQLINDIFSFSKTGDVEYGIAFHMLKYLKHEKEYLPWMAALNGLEPINKLLKRTSNQGEVQNYMRRLLSPVYTNFRNMNEEVKGFEEIRFKNMIIAQACRNQMKDCIHQSLELFSNWMTAEDPDNNNLLPRELKSIIYCQAIKNGGVDEWDFLWERYQRSNIASEKAKLLSALGCSSETWLLNRYLNWTIGDNAVIRKQDAITVFYSVASSDIGFYVAKDFLYRKIADISQYFQPRGDRVGRYVSVIGSQMKTVEELDEIQTFIDKSPSYLKGADLTINQTIETIKINIEWTDKFYKQIITHML
ncbi:Hypothetical protein CINCED_3A003208 [Cinara cedri]|nr:Hypothetical protein CINCED_3A003208 [Cinara cedri]